MTTMNTPPALFFPLQNRSRIPRMLEKSSGWLSFSVCFGLRWTWFEQSSIVNSRYFIFCYIPSLHFHGFSYFRMGLTMFEYIHLFGFGNKN